MSVFYSKSNNELIDLSIIIVNWNSWGYLQKCIMSIKENADGLRYEIIVVDNCSSDNSVINIAASFPEVILIKNKKNVGFPAANNQAFTIARGKYFLMLNPDTLIKNNALQQSLHVLKNEDSIGCIGVKTLKGNGEILFSCARSFPSIWSKFWQIFFIDTIFPKWKFLKPSEMGYWDHNNSCDVDLLHGGYMMFPGSIYRKLGGLDEKLPMFYEDVEYCCRIRKAGFRIYYLADVEIVHFVGISRSKAEPKWIVDTAKLYCEGDYLYFLEYGGGSQAALSYVLMILLCFPLRILYSPFIWLGYLIKNRKTKKMALINLQIITSAIWAIRKLQAITRKRLVTEV
ncbi:MAG: glycosyltransferase family 2 protein [Candidatus Omnitrophota bacterium]